MSHAPPRTPRRLLVVAPSWIGDAAMVTPALRIVRDALPGALIGALLRPGIDAILEGTDLFDQAHVDYAAGVMGPKRVAQKIRLARYDAGIIFANSFSSALITRLAGIPRRCGYARDGRGLLLTDALPALRRRDVEPYSASRTSPGAWAPVPACQYYNRLASHAIAGFGIDPPPPGPMRLVVTPRQQGEADALLERAGVDPDAPMAMLNPGANNPAKRWPADRFAHLADHLASNHGLTVLVNGSPGERDLVRSIVGAVSKGTRAISLPDAGVTLAGLKGTIQRCRLLVTNDTGPRHLGAALGVPVVSLFGPTDHRWTTIPFDKEEILVADPSLPPEEVANDHPQRCAIDRISDKDVCNSADRLLAQA